MIALERIHIDETGSWHSGRVEGKTIPCYARLNMIAKIPTRNVIPNQRVIDILRLLDRTPMPADLILQASETFGRLDDPDDGFTDARRVREKMQRLTKAGLVSVQEYTITHRGATNFYHLTPEAYRLVYQKEPDEKHRRYFRPVARLNWEHVYANAKVIVKTLVSAHRGGIPILHFCRDREITIQAGPYTVVPDHFFQFKTSGRVFNHLFEVDRNTQTLDGSHPKAWRQRILGYEGYQDQLLATKKESLRRLRVTFLTTSIEHAYNFLALARELARNSDRVLFYAATIDAYLNDENPLVNPILLDHHGRWQALVNIHPTSFFIRDPVQLPKQVMEPGLPL